MPRSTLRWNGSLSRGAALMRVVIGAAVLLVAYVAVRHFFPSREERMWRFVLDGRDALVESREADFMASFDPAVRYQDKGGLAEIARDWKRWKGLGIGQATVVSHTADLDEEGADVRLEVVFVAGMTPISTAHVKLRLVERDKAFRVASLSWE